MCIQYVSDRILSYMALGIAIIALAGKIMRQLKNDEKKIILIATAIEYNTVEI